MARRYSAPISYRLRELPVKQIKVWKEAQARKLDRKGIAELAKSIKNEGLQNPPMVQKSGPKEYLLMSGQRRLAALKRLGAKKIPALVLTNNTKYDLDGAKAASVVENLHRNKMAPKDMTAACVFLAESIGKAKAAKALGVSYQTIINYLGFSAVPEKLRELVPHDLTRNECTMLYKAVPTGPKALKIAERVIPLEPSVRKAYLRALCRSPKATHAKLLKSARERMLKQRVAIRLNKTNAKRLRALAMQNDVEVDEMADILLTSQLKKRRVGR